MAEDKLLQDLKRLIDYQLKWKRIMSASYFISTAVAIAAGGAATVTAGLKYHVAAAVLAGTATALIGLEKAMLFREKWAHHLFISTQLQATRFAYEHGELDPAKAAEQIESSIKEYAKLPMAPRD